MNSSASQCPKCSHDLADALEAGVNLCPNCGQDFRTPPTGFWARYGWFLFFTAFVGPGVVSFLALAIGNEGFALGAALGGSVGCGLFCGIFLAARFIESNVLKVLTGIFLSALCALACFGIALLGCESARTIKTDALKQFFTA
jgi:hypothetical protein